VKHFLGLTKRTILVLSAVVAVSVISSACSQNTASKSATSSQPTADAAAAVPTVPSTSLVPGEPHPADRERVPDLLLATPRGEFRLSEQTGKVTLLYFSFPG
jgi:hypothetical protein